MRCNSNSVGSHGSHCSCKRLNLLFLSRSIKSTENKFDITYGHFFDSDDNKSLSKLDVSNPWIPKQLMTTDGSVFYTAARIVSHSGYHWIYFFDSPQEVIVLTTFHNTYHLNMISFLYFMSCMTSAHCKLN